MKLPMYAGLLSAILTCAPLTATAKPPKPRYNCDCKNICKKAPANARYKVKNCNGNPSK